MEVKAYCDLDLQAIQALVRLQMFGKNEPGRRMRFWGAVYGCVAAAIVLEMIAWGFDADLLKLLIVCGIVALVGCNQYFLLPRLHYRSMAKLRGVRNAYTFTDSGMQVSSWGEDMQGQSNFGYGALYKVMQTKRYLFLFQMKNRVFVVDNTTMTGGTVEDIRSVLQPVLGKKYVVCKY